jgi:nitrogen regulatory protein P-II 1
VSCDYRGGAGWGDAVPADRQRSLVSPCGEVGLFVLDRREERNGDTDAGDDDGAHAHSDGRAAERPTLPARRARVRRRAAARRREGRNGPGAKGGIHVMKVEAVVVRDRVETVMEAVEDHTGHVGVTVVEAVGHGREKGITHEYRGRVFESRFLPKAHLTFIVRDEIAEDVIEAIVDAAKTGHVNGDGICWMSPVTTVTHNRTGQKLEEMEVSR